MTQITWPVPRTICVISRFLTKCISFIKMFQMWFFELTIVSDCRNSFNCKFKELIKEQLITFYSLSNALCSSDKFIPIKHFKHHTFIGVCFLCTWLYLKIGKSRFFYSIAINSQSMKKLQRTILRHLQWKSCHEI